MTTTETPARSDSELSTGRLRDTLLAGARELGPLIRDNVTSGERARKLPEATAEGLTEAGLFRLCRPRRLGGLEVDPITLIEVVEEIARHDGSAAWCALNSSIAGVLQAFLPEEGAGEIGTAPDVVVNGVINPGGRAVPVAGGYRVSGRWSFVSNCHACTWLAPASIVVDDDDASTAAQTAPEIVMTWITMSDWRIVDTWDTVGLRATGSHDIEVSDVFVPEHRTFPMPLPNPVQDGALFRFPVVGLFSVGMAAAALGLARAAIDELILLAATKTPFGMASALSTRTTAQIAVCEALAAVGSARAFLLAETTRVWEMLQAGAAVSNERQAFLRISATHATAAAASAIDRMYTTAGGTALFAASPLQRCLRDVHAITQHLFVAPPTYELIGKILLGVETDGFML
jgi:alkylation response protein AidB-like acyl-CoA dehydrogenase